MTSEILTTYWPLILGGLIVLIALIALFRRRGQRVELGRDAPPAYPTLARSVQVEPPPPPVEMPDTPLPELVAVPVSSGAPDDLRRIKGLGPKVAAQLGQLGIVRFEQLAALDADAQAALDAQLGPFAGRMTRDRWIEQADLLARDDIAAFEAQFGKLG